MMGLLWWSMLGTRYWVRARFLTRLFVRRDSWIIISGRVRLTN